MMYPSETLIVLSSDNLYATSTQRKCRGRIVLTLSVEFSFIGIPQNHFLVSSKINVHKNVGCMIVSYLVLLYPADDSPTAGNNRQ